MKIIFKDAFINHYEIVYYIYLIIMLLIIIFGIVMAFKEIKNEYK